MGSASTLLSGRRRRPPLYKQARRRLDGDEPQLALRLLAEVSGVSRPSAEAVVLQAALGRWLLADRCGGAISSHEASWWGEQATSLRDELGPSPDGIRDYVFFGCVWRAPDPSWQSSRYAVNRAVGHFMIVTAPDRQPDSSPAELQRAAIFAELPLFCGLELPNVAAACRDIVTKLYGRPESQWSLEIVAGAPASFTEHSAQMAKDLGLERLGADPERITGAASQLEGLLAVGQSAEELAVQGSWALKHQLNRYITDALCERHGSAEAAANALVARQWPGQGASAANDFYVTLHAAVGCYHDALPGNGLYDVASALRRP